MKRKITFSDYLDKVHGGWLGKCIGGTVGARMENNKDLMHFTYDNVFPDKIPPNDDLDIQLLWLDVLEQKGSGLSSNDLADAWMKAVWYAPNEYGYFVKNYRLGIAPPMSGVFNNHFFKDSMGCPIRSEIWGFISPGTTEIAKQYAYKDGSLDHDTLSIQGEQFFAVLEAEAFFTENLNDLIEIGLSMMPEASILTKCIRFVIGQHETGVSWQEARRQLLTYFSSPDASYSVQNIGLTILALLFGEGNFTETMLIAVNSGYDTDCTAATAGAILGQKLGASQIPEDWLKRMGEEYIIGIYMKRDSLKIYDLALDTCRAGLSLMRDGLLSTEITEIPETIKPSLPIPQASIKLYIEASYIGVPSIGVDSPAEITIRLYNDTPVLQKGTLTIEAPDHLSASFEQADVKVMGNGGFVELSAVFRVEPSARILPQRNLIVLRWMDGGQTLAVCTIGLSGAYRAKVTGPFWDTFDSSIQKDSPFLNRMPEGRYHFNNFINLDKEYLDESFPEVNEIQGKWVDFYEDKLQLNELFPHRGQSCIYLFHDIISPENREVLLNVGHNDGFKCWLNSELVMRKQEHTMWMPYNTEIPIILKQGTNRLIFKVIRSDSNFEFSYGFRGDRSFIEMPENCMSILSHWFVDLGSKIE